VVGGLLLAALGEGETGETEANELLTGSVAERFKAPVLKTGKGLRPS
jgi:hypothetical protein